MQKLNCRTSSIFLTSPTGATSHTGNDSYADSTTRLKNCANPFSPKTHFEVWSDTLNECSAIYRVSQGDNKSQVECDRIDCIARQFVNVRQATGGQLAAVRWHGGQNGGMLQVCRLRWISPGLIPTSVVVVIVIVRAPATCDSCRNNVMPINTVNRNCDFRRLSARSICSYNQLTSTLPPPLLLPLTNHMPRVCVCVCVWWQVASCSGGSSRVVCDKGN